MERDLKSISVDEHWLLNASDRTESATLNEKLHVQKQKIERLNEFCNQVVTLITDNVSQRAPQNPRYKRRSDSNHIVLCRLR
jgi:hypothetical protein